MENSVILYMIGFMVTVMVVGIFMLAIMFKALDIRRAWRDYYYTDTWQEKRRAAFVIHGRKCAVCGTAQNLQVHHLRYWKWGFPIQGRENPKKDLRVLCKEHHRRGHYPLWRIRLDRWWYRLRNKRRGPM